MKTFKKYFSEVKKKKNKDPKRDKKTKEKQKTDKTKNKGSDSYGLMFDESKK